MEGNEEIGESNTGTGDSDIVITGPKGTKVIFRNPKLQVVIALIVGLLTGIGVTTWLL